MLFSIDHSFAGLRKKKKPKSTTVSQDSVWRKPVPFDLYSSSFDMNELIKFAKKQMGTPYKYASCNPDNGGLDCSGFVYYVFQHFNIVIPRSSKDYMSFGTAVDMENAKQGDVIVFTGTDASERVGGHVGIVLQNNKNDITFIHSSSGKSKGVIISKLSQGYYSERFLKVVRVIN